MRSKTTIPAVGSIGDVYDAGTQRSLNSLKQAQEIREGIRGGDFLDKTVLWRDLVDLGLITESQVPRK